MSVMTESRSTPRREGDQFSDPVAATAVILGGALVVLNATGYAAPGSTATGLAARGVAEETVDNSAGADGALNVAVRKGVYQFKNDSGDPVTIADVESTVYITDDQTICKTDATGTKSAAGKLVAVDANGAWVEIR